MKKLSALIAVLFASASLAAFAEAPTKSGEPAKAEPAKVEPAKVEPAKTDAKAAMKSEKSKAAKHPVKATTKHKKTTHHTAKSTKKPPKSKPKMKEEPTK